MDLPSSPLPPAPRSHRAITDEIQRSPSRCIDSSMSGLPSPAGSLVGEEGIPGDISSEEPLCISPEVNADEEDVEVTFATEAPTLLANLGVNEESTIRMVNVERWRIRPTIYTLDFQIVCPEIEESYKKLADEMKDFYERPESKRYQFLPEVLELRKMELAVIRTLNGDFKRIRVLRLEENEEWEINEQLEPDFEHRIELLGRDLDDEEDIHKDCCDETGGASGTNSTSCTDTVCSSAVVVVDEIPPSDPRVVLVDENVNLPGDWSGITWFHLLERFCFLPFRTRECFLTDTGLFQGYNEFRDVAAPIFAAEDAFECKVDRINQNNIPFVTLRSRKWSKSINDTLCIKTVEAFPPPSLPPVGKTMSGVTLSHSNDNGEIYLQFKATYMFSMFHRTEQRLNEKKYQEAKAKGPYELKHNTFYLAPYDGWYYRCHITGRIVHDSPKVSIFFTDYGNVDDMDKSELVPCAEVDEIFNAFAKQAVRAHLRNIGAVAWNLVMNHLPEDVTYVVETLVEQTADDVAFVELLSTNGTDIMMLSKSLVCAKYAVNWTGKLLDNPLVVKKAVALEGIPSIIPMRSANWSEFDTKIVLAEPGAILEVYVSGVNRFGITVSTVHAAARRENLRQEIMKWFFWDYLRELTDSEYGDHVYDMIEIGKVFLVSQYPGKYFAEQQPMMENHFSRVRVLEWSGSRAVRVHFLDRGAVGEVEISFLQPLDPKFCKLPAQGAILTINGFQQVLKEHCMELNSKMAGTKFLVKVESVHYEDKTERCNIKGDLFPFGTLNLSDDSRFPIGKSHSMGPDEAQEIDLGKPLTPAFFLRPRPPVPTCYDQMDLSPRTLSRSHFGCKSSSVSPDLTN